MPTKPRVAIINSHPIQYFTPLYAYLTAQDEIDVTILYCSDSSLRGAMDPGFLRPVAWDIDLMTGYRSKFLGGGARRRTPAGFWSLICPELLWELDTGRYDAVVVHGHQFAAYVLAALLCRARQIPVLCRSDSRIHPGSRSAAYWTILKAYTRLFDGFLAIGTSNRRYYEHLGARAQDIFHAPLAVDNARFSSAAKLTADERASTLAEYGLSSSSPVVLFAGKLTRGKRADDLLSAAATLQAEGVALQLLIVGSGEMGAELESRARELAIRDVSFAGFVNQRQLPRIFGAADVFVLPAEGEAWGLVVNEAMCAGLPIIVASEVGCAPDLVPDGANGRVVPPGDVLALTAALRELVCDADLRSSMGQASRVIISSWGIEAWSRGLHTAVQAILARRDTKRVILGPCKV